MKNGLQKAMDQIGSFAVAKYIPKGMKICPCDLHGAFLSHYKNTSPLCPLCIKTDPSANGTISGEVSLYIDLTQSSIKALPDELRTNTSMTGLHA